MINRECKWKDLASLSLNDSECYLAAYLFESKALCFVSVPMKPLVQSNIFKF